LWHNGRMVNYKSIPNYPGYYAGSDGTIWSCHNNKWGIDPQKWKQLSEGRNNKYGRRIVVLKRDDGRVTTRYVHQLILESFCGPCPPQQECRHLNGNAGDNRLENLKWGSREENMADKQQHGRGRGEHCSYSILTNQDIHIIRTRAAAGETHESISKDFPVQRRQISRIVQGVRWAHI
jgi:hypothetical protein